MLGVSPDHQPLVIRADIHNADVVTHDEQNVGLLVLPLCHAGVAMTAKTAKTRTIDFMMFLSLKLKTDFCISI